MTSTSIVHPPAAHPMGYPATFAAATISDPATISAPVTISAPASCPNKQLVQPMHGTFVYCQICQRWQPFYRFSREQRLPGRRYHMCLACWQARHGHAVRTAMPWTDSGSMCGLMALWCVRVRIENRRITVSIAPMCVLSWSRVVYAVNRK